MVPFFAVVGEQWVGGVNTNRVKRQAGEGGDDSLFFIDHKPGLQAVVLSCCSEFFFKSETYSPTHLIHKQ